MKKPMTISWIFGTAAVLSLAVACGNRDQTTKAQKALNERLEQNALGKPSSQTVSVPLSSLGEGLYRLRSVRIQADSVRNETTAEGPKSFTTSLLGTQSFQPDQRSRSRFALIPDPAEQNILSNDPHLAEQDLVMTPELKVPLTVRANGGAVSFEQIRRLWYCLKLKTPCDSKSHLSEGSSTKAEMIHPALYLAKKSLVPGGTDVETRIDTMTTSIVSNGFTIYFESPTASGLIQRFELNYVIDVKRLQQDDLGNPSEEKLAVEPQAP